MRRRRAGLLVSLTFALPSALAGQIPERFENLEVLPKDITRPELIEIMRGFALDLGVRCTYCHVERAPGGGASGLDLDFRSDAKVSKAKARVMMRMVGLINDSVLPSLPGRSQPAVRVQCLTCHRGLAVPKSLERVLAETFERDGVDSAIVQYRRLRGEALGLGRYDFGEGTLTRLARQLAGANAAAALRILELNQEYFPRSAGIDYEIAEVHRTRGDRVKAIEHYRKALDKAPDHALAKRRLAELGG